MDARTSSLAARNSGQYEHVDAVIENNSLRSINEVAADTKLREKQLLVWHGCLDDKVKKSVQ
jgi:phage antirepressor YoqD-like protein